MISLIRGEFVEKRQWISSEEFTDMIAISESTPGPLAINSATYVGYKLGGFWGALCATIGVVLPSFVIIFVISLFLQAFLEFRLVAAAFKGIQVAVAFLILSAGVKMFLEMGKNPVTVTVAALTFLALLMLDIFAVSFSSVWMILAGAAVGLVAYACLRAAERKRTPAAGADGESAKNRGIPGRRGRARQAKVVAAKRGGMKNPGDGDDRERQTFSVRAAGVDKIRERPAEMLPVGENVQTGGGIYQ